jgi:hypothetical protein
VSNNATGAVAEMMRAEYEARRLGASGGGFIVPEPQPQPPPIPVWRPPAPDWEAEERERLERERLEREAQAAKERQEILDAIEAEKSLEPLPAPKSRKLLGRRP